MRGPDAVIASSTPPGPKELPERRRISRERLRSKDGAKNVRDACRGRRDDPPRHGRPVRTIFAAPGALPWAPAGTLALGPRCAESRLRTDHPAAFLVPRFEPVTAPRPTKTQSEGGVPAPCGLAGIFGLAGAYTRIDGIRALEPNHSYLYRAADDTLPFARQEWHLRWCCNFLNRSGQIRDQRRCLRLWGQTK